MDEDLTEAALDVPETESPLPRGMATDTVYHGLRLMAHRLGPNAKLPPVRHLREQFGVSRTTLDAAMTRLEGQRVLLRRERSGVYVAPHLRQRSVCLLCEPAYFLQHSASPFWSLLIDRLQRAARAEDIRLSVVFTNPLPDGPRSDLGEDATTLPDWLRTDVETGKVHGILTVGLRHPVARWIEARGVPVVAYAGAAQYIVTTPATDIIRMGTAALARSGCRRLCLWETSLPVGDDPDAHNWLEKTFVDALEAQGLTLSSGAFFRHMTETSAGPPRSSVQTGWEAAHHYFGPDADPAQPFDGVVSCDDMITQGGLMALQRLGVHLGADVQIATHANSHSPALLGWEDRVFRMEYDLDLLVQSLLETLDALIEGAADQRFIFDPAEEYGPVPEHYRHIHPRLIVPEVFSREFS